MRKKKEKKNIFFIKLNFLYNFSLKQILTRNFI